MQRTVTLLALGLLWASTASAQLDRSSGDAADVVWARDIGQAIITLDGNLNEPQWAQAEKITFQWNDPTPLPFPGSGQWFDINGGNPFGLTEPADPIDATLSILRKGNSLYFALEASDASIGGSSGLWAIDGVFMTLIDKNNRAESFSEIDDYFGSTREEFAFSWWNRGRGQDTTAAGRPIPGIQPFFYSQTFGSEYSDPDSTDNVDREAADFGHTIDGVSNDDTNGQSSATSDTGYTLEFMISVDSLGWDLTQEMARMPLSIAVQDADYAWPTDESRFSVTRVWWQGQWLNTLSQGTGYIAADPSVTVNSGATPAYSVPEFTVVNANRVPLTVDGVLDEEAWADTDPQFTLKYKATPEELDAGLPGVLAPYYSFYFHPDGNEVVDNTEGRVRMLYKGSMLYLGLDTNDNAVNGIDGESGRDGFRLIIRSRDSTQSSLQAEHLRFDFSVDSTGAMRFNTVPDEIDLGTDLVGAVSLKGSSTVADPSDIDSGYQMEVAIDLTAIGYPEDLNGERIWVSLNYFDGDALENDAQSYSTRTWSMGERTNGASIMAYLDPDSDLAVTSENGPGEVGLRALGSYPNPTAGTATVRYGLPRAAEVTVEVFDVLGRKIQTVETGFQTEGVQTTTLDASGLSAGAYVYRVRLEDGTSVTGRMLVTR